MWNPWAARPLPASVWLHCDNMEGQSRQQQPFLEALLHAGHSPKHAQPRCTSPQAQLQREVGAPLHRRGTTEATYFFSRRQNQDSVSAQTPVPRHCRAGCSTRGRWEAPRSPVTEQCVCYLREGPQRGPVTARGFRLSWEGLCTKWFAYLTLRRQTARAI